MEKTELVSLGTLARGACIERFDDAFARILDNILDPNSSATAKREVNLKVTVKPDEKRSFCTVSICCTAKTAPPINVQTQIFVGTDGKHAIATEHNPQQLGLGLQKPTGTVVEFKKEGDTK